MPVWFRGRGGGWCESWSPPTLYSPGGKLVFCNMDSRKSGGCVPPNARLSRLIRFAAFDPVVVYSSVPGRAVCLSVSVPVWFRGRGGGWCSSLRPCTSRMSWRTPHGRAVAPKMIKLRRSSIFPVIFFTVLVVLRVGFSSGRLGSVGFGWVSFPTLRGREGNLT